MLRHTPQRCIGGSSPQHCNALQYIALYYNVAQAVIHAVKGLPWEEGVFQCSYFCWDLELGILKGEEIATGENHRLTPTHIPLVGFEPGQWWERYSWQSVAIFLLGWLYHPWLYNYIYGIRAEKGSITKGIHLTIWTINICPLILNIINRWKGAISNINYYNYH